MTAAERSSIRPPDRTHRPWWWWLRRDHRRTELLRMYTLGWLDCEQERQHRLDEIRRLS